ncbi:MAG: hypothetical protein QXX91_01770 [Thermoplasmata archaeon]
MDLKNNRWIKNEQKKNNRIYLKCLVEGMRDWLDIKEKAGNIEIRLLKPKIEKEINAISKKEVFPIKVPKLIINKMKNLEVNRELIMEFKGIFYKKGSFKIPF